MDATVIRKIGKYEITGVLGRGGMGVVYRAEDRRIGRLVAIKTLTEGFTGQPEMLERFYREAQAGILQHPNIVIVYDLGDEDGVPYIVMEHVDGTPLDKLIASGRQLPLLDRLSIIEQVCAALGYAHQRGVIHRDIKPANVIVQPDGHAKIVDFGIARVQTSAADTGLTRTGSVIGTIHYIAPERLKGQPFDGRSDIFSTGVMLYLLLTGQLPFNGEDMTVLQKLVNEPHPPLSSFVANYPPALDAIIDRALAKDPAQRYATAEEFAADLHAVAEELKQGRVSELFNDAERLTSEQQFGRARDILLQVVRIDSQHTGARQLLAIVQQHLSRQQRAEQVLQLLAQAEEALAAQRFADAVAVLEQTAKIDPENADVQTRLEAAREQWRRREELDALIAQADHLRENGDFSGAHAVLERALQLDPENAELRRAHATAAREVKLAAQRGQVREMLGQARQEISSRRFTAAIEILREAGKLDPSAPDLEGLLQTAVSGQEQERRRRLVEQIHSEIESCLLSDNYDRALDMANRAVEQLPTEASLLQLRTRVTTQARAWRVRQTIDSAVSRAQEVFPSSPAEALEILHKALEELPGEERLLQVEASLRERLKTAEKEEFRARWLREAQTAIDRSEFEKAVEVLESYQLEFADAAGVSDLLEFARGELAAQQKRNRVAECTSRARALLEEERFAEAIRLLDAASAETGDASLARMLADARAQETEFSRKAEALLTRVTRLRERGQLDEAIELLQSTPAAALQGSAQHTLLNEIRGEQARRQAVIRAKAAASEALERRDFDAGLESLQSVRRAYGDSEELTQAIAEVEAKRTQIANDGLGQAVEKARAALLSSDAAGALAELQKSAGLVEFASAAQQADWRRLRTEAAKPAARRTNTGEIALADIAAGAEEAEPRPAKKLIPAIAAAALVIAALAAAGFWWTHREKPATPQTAQAPAATAAPAPKTPPAAAPTGTLLIQGNTDGVGVFVDGPVQGFTQSDGTLRLPLDPGTHSIRFAKAGYQDSPAQSVTIRANQEQKLRFDLAKSASASAPVETTAYLMVHSTPGARVSVDGQSQGTTDPRGNLIVQVKPGTRSLKIALDGYQPAAQTFTLKAGQRTDVAALLSPVPSPVKAAPAAVPASPPVQIVSFSAADSQIEQGQATTLRWETANASDVSIDNGIARVDASGQTTVRPAATTTYVLTAKGSSGVLQRSVNVIVEPKVEKAAAPVTKAPEAVDPSTQLRSVVGSFEAAWNAHDIARVQAVWTGLKSQQVRGLESFFKGNPQARVADDCPASALNLSGNTASWSCSETTTLMVNGKPLVHAQEIRFTFARKGGSWTIADRR